MFGAIQSTIVKSFNWYYVLITSFFVAFSLFLGFSRFGDSKPGHDDDEPEFSLMAWFSLLFAAGMGIGLVFYGVGEPLSHFASPRPGVSGTPPELAQQALSQTYLHWGVHAWSIYVVIGLALAYAIHRRKRPVSIRWALEPLLGKRVRGAWGNVIDVVALVGTRAGTGVPEEIMPSPEPSTAAVDTLMAAAQKPRHASERALQVENAEADGVLIADVDTVVDHDPRASQDVQDVPNRGDATPSRW